MGALRQVAASLGTTVGLRGVRMDDEVMLDIFQERKKTFKLNRTRYTFTTDKMFELNLKESVITFPVFSNEVNAYQLDLVTDFQSRDHNNKSRYIMKSLGNAPFRLNGVYCFEAFLERGDVVDIGFNRIHFLKEHNDVGSKKSVPEKIVKGNISVMIEGETGTGKTTLARKIHDESGRAGHFIHINLSAFAPSLIESEIFGHIRGAFTGAIHHKRGAVLEANRGTLFLDEIDSLTLDLQTKLLLFLDDYRVRPVGGDSFHKVDVRMIFAAGTPLKKKVEEGKMRADFYYRLQAGYSVHLESLRSETSKIVELCRAFEYDQAVVICEEAIKFYSTCAWPGNIRQLHSHLQKKKIFSDGKKITLDELDQELLTDSFNLGKLETGEITTLEEMKLNYCYEVFLRLNRNVTKTSKVLELSCNTLKSYLRKKEKALGNDDVGDVDV